MPTHMLGNDTHVRAMKVIANNFLHVANMYSLQIIIGGGQTCNNVQNRFVHFFLLSFLIFCSPRAKALCFEGESPRGKNDEKV